MKGHLRQMVKKMCLMFLCLQDIILLPSVECILSRKHPFLFYDFLNYIYNIKVYSFIFLGIFFQDRNWLIYIVVINFFSNPGSACLLFKKFSLSPEFESIEKKNCENTIFQFCLNIIFHKSMIIIFQHVCLILQNWRRKSQNQFSSNV